LTKRRLGYKIKKKKKNNNDFCPSCVQTWRDRSPATHRHLAPRAVSSCFSVPYAT